MSRSERYLKKHSREKEIKLKKQRTILLLKKRKKRYCLTTVQYFLQGKQRRKWGMEG